MERVIFISAIITICGIYSQAVHSLMSWTCSQCFSNKFDFPGILKTFQEELMKNFIYHHDRPALRKPFLLFCDINNNNNNLKSLELMLPCLIVVLFFLPIKVTFHIRDRRFFLFSSEFESYAWVLILDIADDNGKWEQ